MCLGIALLGMDEGGKEDGVADEEDGRVVAHQVPVALLGVELEREAAWVAHRVGRAALASDRGEAHRQRSALAHRGEHGRLAVACDVVRHLKVAERTWSYGQPVTDGT